MSSSQGHDSIGFEKLRELAEKSAAPEIKKSATSALVDMQRITREVRDTLSNLNLFNNPAKHAGEYRQIPIRDKRKRTYEYTVDSDGKSWGNFGYSIQPTLNFILNTYPDQQHYKEAVDQSISQNEPHLRFHKRIIDTHPIIGTAILLARARLASASKYPEYAAWAEKEKNKEIAPTRWYEDHMNKAETAFKALDAFFEQLGERIDDTVTDSFLSDAKKECELLIAECAYFSFLLGNHCIEIIESKNSLKIPNIVKDTPFPISPTQYAERERNILNLRNAYLEYLGDKPLLHAFPLPSMDTVKETGEIRLPAYLSPADLSSILEQYQMLWVQMSESLKSAGKARSGSDIRIVSGSSTAQDRLSFSLPSFNIRFDKDVRHNSITMDIGGASIDHALACAESYLEKTIIGKKISSIFRNTADLDKESVKFENQMALVASLMLNASKPVALRTKPTTSHHSREFVGKKEYFDNFSHILSTLKQALERRA